ncbi:MAG: carboxypeptidase regulatory-like domain-containing protein [Ardenticatenales bacterium]|nr:carboxypeptidase regulatory-like domain-containing protein [Ardenticatenales bacterium]
MPESKIRAVEHSTQEERHVLTNAEGQFELVVMPGTWNLTVSQPGYLGSVPIAYDKAFTESEEKLDFVLSPAARITGTVRAAQNRDRLGNAVIQAVRQPEEGMTTSSQTHFAGTNDAGDYQFQNLPPGIWTLNATCDKYFSSQTHSVQLGVGKTESVDFALHQISGTNDRSAGCVLLSILACLSLVLIMAYAYVHHKFPAGEKAAILGLINTVVETQSRVSSEVEASLTMGMRDPDDETDSQLAAPGISAELESALSDLDKNVRAASNILTLEESLAIVTVLQQVKEAREEGDLVRLNAAMQPLADMLAATTPDEYFWTEPPFSFLEVIIWATFGVLSYLIGKTAWNLRWNKFYWEEIALHLSQLFTIPVMALVASWLLSLVDLTFQLGETAVQINLSDPHLLAALAFVLGFQPWDLTGFLSQTIGRFIGRNGSNGR